MFKVNKKDIRTVPLACSYVWRYFTPCSSASIVDFEQANAGWKASTFQICENLEQFVLNSSLVGNENPTKILQKLRVINVNRFIIGHINISLLRNRFEISKDCIKCIVDIWLIPETKLDESFPITQFKIEGFTTPYRRDIDKNGGCVLLYVKVDIPSKQVSLKSDDTNIENFFIGINLRKKKVAFRKSGSYDPHSNLIETKLLITFQKSFIIEYY